MPFLETTRRGILALIGGLGIFRPTRADGQDTFTLSPQLAVGQAFTYQLDQKVQRNGVVAVHAGSRVTLTVLRRLEGGWLVRWTTSDSHLRVADPNLKPLFAALQSVWDGLPVDVLLDTTGRVSGVADTPTLRALVTAAMDRVADHLSNDASQAPFAAAMRAAVTSLLANDTLLAQSLLKEISILLGATGHAYRAGEPLAVNSRIDSPFGTGEIPILGRFKIESVDPQARRATLNWLMVVDRGTAARVIGAEVEQVVEGFAEVSPEARQLDAPALVSDALSGFDFDDRGEFVVDTGTAWPVSVSHVRRVSTGAGSRVDEIRFSRLGG